LAGLGCAGQQGALVVELDKPSGRPLSLGLTPGEYRVLWVDDAGDLARADLTLATGTPGALSKGDFQSVDGALAVRRGDEPLTPQAFNISAVPLPYLTRSAYGVELALLGTRSLSSWASSTLAARSSASKWASSTSPGEPTEAAWASSTLLTASVQPAATYRPGPSGERTSGRELHCP
jgi:hypothetical protein